MRTDGRRVKYSKFVEICWGDSEIVANFSDEKLRLQVLSFVVEDLRKRGPKKAVN